jgi:hypothetical protein
VGGLAGQEIKRKLPAEGENVVAFPKLAEFQQITLKVLRWEARDKRLVIKEVQMAART